MIKIKAEQWMCVRCGKFFYVNCGAGVLMGTRCPFYCQNGVGKFIREVRITI